MLVAGKLLETMKVRGPCYPAIPAYLVQIVVGPVQLAVGLSLLVAARHTEDRSRLRTRQEQSRQT